LGHRSPADWYRHAHENEPVRWLARGLEPSRDAWYRFRDRLGLVLLEFNRQLLDQAQCLAITDAEATWRQRLALLEAACEQDTKGHMLRDRPAWMARRRGRPRQRRLYQRALARLEQQKQDNQDKRACDRKEENTFRVSQGDSQSPLGLDKQGVYRPLYNVQYLRDLSSRRVLSYGVFAQVNDAGTLQPLL
jgi:hypothetical protein